jgi:hypothetical protein
MSQTIESQSTDKQQAIQQEGLWSYIGTVLISMMFPITVLFQGPRYLIRREYWKGILLFAIVAIELIIVFSYLEL